MEGRQVPGQALHPEEQFHRPVEQHAVVAFVATGRYADCLRPDSIPQEHIKWRECANKSHGWITIDRGQFFGNSSLFSIARSLSGRWSEYGYFLRHVDSLMAAFFLIAGVHPILARQAYRCIFTMRECLPLPPGPRFRGDCFFLAAAVGLSTFLTTTTPFGLLHRPRTWIDHRRDFFT